MRRRFFLHRSAMAMASLGVAPHWLVRTALGNQTAPKRNQVLVVVFQRGAADGLNIVAPYTEQRYYSLRPNIAVPRPGQDGGLLDLDGEFGLHPALRALKPLFDERQLAVVHAAGSPHPTRSHFDAQDYMESGTPGRKSTPDGWLNRALDNPATETSPVRAVALDKRMPRTLDGGNPAVALSSLKEFRVHGAAETFESMYMESADAELHATAQESFAAVRTVRALAQQPYRPANGANYPGGTLGPSLQQIAQLIKADAGLEVAFAEMGGWDHHANEAPQLARMLRHFGDSLAAFHRDLGERAADVTVVTMSEFGRTAEENGNRGTDHGHGNVMFVMGGGVSGGKVYGQWPTLSYSKLYQHRDLAVTTDFRAVLGELLTQRLGVQDLSTVFPGYSPGASLGLLTSDTLRTTARWPPWNESDS